MSTNGSSILQKSAIISGLVSKQQLQEAMAVARQPVSGPPTPLMAVTDDLLARELINMGLITQYQAEQLKAGRTKLTLGPYLVTDFVAQGGMGQVFKAEHQMMGREVAVKVLPHNRSTPDSIENFTREIRTQAILDHHNLVRAYDAGRDGNVYYLVTEYVPGTDLRRLVRVHGMLNMQQAASIVCQAAHGLQSAHEKGLIHRDVKPGNILVTPQGHAKVSDLGLAGFLSEGADDPRTSKIVGTSDFISPEQIRTPESITPTSDVYSLGCTLYYAITAKVPFPGGSTADKIRRHCEETPFHPRRFNPNLSEEFVEILADMMEKSSSHRIQTMQDVITRLEPISLKRVVLPPQQPTRSPWMPPPVPASDSSSLNEDDLQATQEGSYDDLQISNDASSAGSLGWGSVLQRTRSEGSPSSETQVPRPKPAIPIGDPVPNDHAVNNAIMVTLAISIPISMLIGALATLVVLLWR